MGSSFGLSSSVQYNFTIFDHFFFHISYFYTSINAFGWLHFRQGRRPWAKNTIWAGSQNLVSYGLAFYGNGYMGGNHGQFEKFLSF